MGTVPKSEILRYYAVSRDARTIPANVLEVSNKGSRGDIRSKEDITKYRYNLGEIGPKLKSLNGNFTGKFLII